MPQSSALLAEAYIGVPDEMRSAVHRILMQKAFDFQKLAIDSAEHRRIAADELADEIMSGLNRVRKPFDSSF